jgi:CRISPR-associated protein Cas6/Cse3/CasE subtype I-E
MARLRTLPKARDRISFLYFEHCRIIKREHQSSIIRTVQFDGVLQVVNPADFLGVLSHGIGRGKSYGCGLLSLAPVR